MASPTKNWTTITDSQVDADSPLDQTLMTGMRDNLVHLEEWLGNSYTAAQDHDHDGVNSKLVAGVADESITGPKIKNDVPTGSNVGTQTIAASANYVPSAGVYAFMGATLLLFEIYSTGSSSWVTASVGLNGGVFICDGTNMRVKNTDASSSQTLYWWRF